MSEEKFEELVNLYFDREINSSDLEWLKQELATNLRRRRAFEARHRLHQAMSQALHSDGAAEQFPLSRRGSSLGRLSTWAFGSGLAACFSIGFVLVAPAVMNSSAVASLTSARVDADELPELEKSNFQRYAASQAASSRPRGSLAALLRLSGLKPDMAPAERQLQGVDFATLQRSNERGRGKIDLLNQFKDFSLTGESRLFEAMPHLVRFEKTPSWPSGFETTLASF